MVFASLALCGMSSFDSLLGRGGCTTGVVAETGALVFDGGRMGIDSGAVWKVGLG